MFFIFYLIIAAKNFVNTVRCNLYLNGIIQLPKNVVFLSLHVKFWAENSDSLLQLSFLCYALLFSFYLWPFSTNRWFSCALEACKVGSENDARFDGVVLVSDSLNNANNFGDVLIQQSTVILTTSNSSEYFINMNIKFMFLLLDRCSFWKGGGRRFCSVD